MTDPSWSKELRGVQHDDVVMTDAQAHLETLAQRMSHMPFDSEQGRERGAALLRALRAGRRATETPYDTVGLGPQTFVGCSTLPSPTFSLQSSGSDTATTYSRANAQAGTLEVHARTGTFGGIEYPSGGGSFLMPFNSATAWIGSAVPIPAHGSSTHSTVTILEVSVEFRIENIWSHAPVVPGSGDDLVFVVRGDGDLPLRGNAVAWGRIGLTLYGSGGARSRKSAEIVSAWVNRDGSDSEDHVPSGALTLQHAAAIDQDLRVAGVFVDITCFAAAEIAPSKWDSAFAEFKCRSGDGFPPPSQIRVDHQEGVSLRLCEMPAVGERLDTVSAG
jgi:hypothetical protein